MKTIRPKFVVIIPDVIEAGVLYITAEYCTAIHLCVCGCGNEVVTPLAPTDWRITFDGSISLYPSIGNWNFPCKSHYWIRNNKIQHAFKWSDEKIHEGRKGDIVAKSKYYNKKGTRPSST
jgi:hypothetical protein